MIIYLNISSKQLCVLNNFLKILCDFRSRNLTKLKILNVKSKKKHKTVISVLKSPHVNKTAQEQFESVVYKKQVVVCSYDYNLLFCLLKSFNHRVLPELTLKIKLKLHRSFLTKQSKIYINPSNQILTNNLFLIKEYLKILDSYGELLIKQKLFKKF